MRVLSDETGWGVEVIVKHATASVFLFHRGVDGWRLGLIEHPRLGRWMIPGGHVEVDETEAEAGLRETIEESGLVARLVALTNPPVPAGFTHPLVTVPWWIAEQAVPADSHLDEPHVHVDHQYVGVVDDPEPVSAPAHRFEWFSAEDLAGVRMFDDTRLLATVLFSCIDELAVGRLDPTSVIRLFADAEA